MEPINRQSTAAKRYGARNGLQQYSPNRQPAQTVARPLQSTAPGEGIPPGFPGSPLRVQPSGPDYDAAVAASRPKPREGVPPWYQGQDTSGFQMKGGNGNGPREYFWNGINVGGDGHKNAIHIMDPNFRPGGDGPHDPRAGLRGQNPTATGGAGYVPREPRQRSEPMQGGLLPQYSVMSPQGVAAMGALTDRFASPGTDSAGQSAMAANRYLGSQNPSRVGELGSWMHGTGPQSPRGQAAQAYFNQAQSPPRYDSPVAINIAKARNPAIQNSSATEYNERFGYGSSKSEARARAGSGMMHVPITPGKVTKNKLVANATGMGGVMNHEGEHAFSQTPSMSNEGKAREIPAVLGDLAFMGERFRAENSGQPLEGRVNFPSGTARNLSWMNEQARQRGYFGGRSMTDLAYNTPEGRAFIDSIMPQEYPQPSPTGESPTSGAQDVQSASQMNPAMAAAMAQAISSAPSRVVSPQQSTPAVPQQQSASAPVNQDELQEAAVAERNASARTGGVLPPQPQPQQPRPMSSVEMPNRAGVNPQGGSEMAGALGTQAPISPVEMPNRAGVNPQGGSEMAGALGMPGSQAISPVEMPNRTGNNPQGRSGMAGALAQPQPQQPQGNPQVSAQQSPAAQAARQAMGPQPQEQALAEIQRLQASRQGLGASIDEAMARGRAEARANSPIEQSRLRAIKDVQGAQQSLAASAQSELGGYADMANGQADQMAAVTNRAGDFGDAVYDAIQNPMPYKGINVSPSAVARNRTRSPEDLAWLKSKGYEVSPEGVVRKAKSVKPMGRTGNITSHGGTHYEAAESLVRSYPQNYGVPEGASEEQIQAIINKNAQRIGASRERYGIPAEGGVDAPRSRRDAILGRTDLNDAQKNAYLSAAYARRAAMGKPLPGGVKIAMEGGGLEAAYALSPFIQQMRQGIPQPQQDAAGGAAPAAPEMPQQPGAAMPITPEEVQEAAKAERDANAAAGVAAPQQTKPMQLTGETARQATWQAPPDDGDVNRYIGFDGEGGSLKSNPYFQQATASRARNVERMQQRQKWRESRPGYKAQQAMMSGMQMNPELAFKQQALQFEMGQAAKQADRQARIDELDAEHRLLQTQLLNSRSDQERDKLAVEIETRKLEQEKLRQELEGPQGPSFADRYNQMQADNPDATPADIRASLEAGDANTELNTMAYDQNDPGARLLAGVPASSQPIGDATAGERIDSYFDRLDSSVGLAAENFENVRPEVMAAAIEAEGINQVQIKSKASEQQSTVTGVVGKENLVELTQATPAFIEGMHKLKDTDPRLYRDLMKLNLLRRASGQQPLVPNGEGLRRATGSSFRRNPGYGFMGNPLNPLSL